MSPALTRRRLVQAGGVTIGGAMLPAGISRAISVEEAPTDLPGAVPPAFDAAAFVADVRAAGMEIAEMWEPPGPGWEVGRAAYCIGPGALGTFGGKPWLNVMQKWGDAINACPEHVERVVAHLFGEARTFGRMPT